jgi:hypothetical protein
LILRKESARNTNDKVHINDGVTNIIVADFPLYINKLKVKDIIIINITPIQVIIAKVFVYLSGFSLFNVCYNIFDSVQYRIAKSHIAVL